MVMARVMAAGMAVVEVMVAAVTVEAVVMEG